MIFDGAKVTNKFARKPTINSDVNQAVEKKRYRLPSKQFCRLFADGLRIRNKGLGDE